MNAVIIPEISPIIGLSILCGLPLIGFTLYLCIDYLYSCFFEQRKKSDIPFSVARKLVAYIHNHAGCVLMFHMLVVLFVAGTQGYNAATTLELGMEVKYYLTVDNHEYDVVTTIAEALNEHAMNKVLSRAANTRRKLVASGASEQVMSFIYSTEDYANLLEYPGTLLEKTCELERELKAELSVCLHPNPIEFDSIVSATFPDDKSCKLQSGISMENIAYQFGSTPRNKLYIEDHFNPSKASTKVLMAFTQLYTCLDFFTVEELLQLLENVSAHHRPLKITVGNATYQKDEFILYIFNSGILTTFAVLLSLGFLIIFVRGLLTSFMTVFCMVAALLIAAGSLLPVFHFGSFSALNMLGTFILLGVSANDVLLFGAAWQDIERSLLQAISDEKNELHHKKLSRLFAYNNDNVHQDFALQLREIYGIYNFAKIQYIPLILENFRGREFLLLEKLHQKYGVSHSSQVDNDSRRAPDANLNLLTSVETTEIVFKHNALAPAYERVGKAALFSTVAAGLSLLSKVSSPVIIIAQLGAFIGSGVVLFYICFHLIVIPCWCMFARFRLLKLIDNCFRPCCATRLDSGYTFGIGKKPVSKDLCSQSGDEMHDKLEDVISLPKSGNVDKNEHYNMNKNEDKSDDIDADLPNYHELDLEQQNHEEDDYGLPAYHELDLKHNIAKDKKYMLPILPCSTREDGEKSYEVVKDDLKFHQEDDISSTNDEKYEENSDYDLPSYENIDDDLDNLSKNNGVIITGWVKASAPIGCGIFIFLVLLGILATGVMSANGISSAKLDLGVPQLFRESSNLGRLLRISKMYKSDVMSSGSPSESSLSQPGQNTAIVIGIAGSNAPTLHPTASPTITHAPSVVSSPTTNPTLSPTYISTTTLSPTYISTITPSSASSTAPSSAPTFTSQTISPTVSRNNSEVRAYVDYVGTGCFGFNYEKTERDALAKPIYASGIPGNDMATFKRYVDSNASSFGATDYYADDDHIKGGFLDDLIRMCLYVDQHREALSIHPDYDTLNQCSGAAMTISLAAVKAEKMANPFGSQNYTVSEAVFHYGYVVNYARASLVGVQLNDSNEVAAAGAWEGIGGKWNRGYVPIWFCTSFPLRTYVETLIGEEKVVHSILDEWNRVFSSDVMPGAAGHGIPLIFGADAFRLPLLAAEVLESLYIAAFSSLVGCIALVYMFTMDLSHTLLVAFCLVWTIATTIFIQVSLYNDTVDLLDIVIIIALVGMSLDFPVHSVVHYAHDLEHADSEHPNRPGSMRLALYMAWALVPPTVMTAVAGIPLFYADLALLVKTGHYVVFMEVLSYLLCVLGLPPMIGLTYPPKVLHFLKKRFRKFFWCNGKKNIEQGEFVSPKSNFSSNNRIFVDGEFDIVRENLSNDKEAEDEFSESGKFVAVEVLDVESNIRHEEF